MTTPQQDHSATLERIRKLEAFHAKIIDSHRTIYGAKMRKAREKMGWSIRGTALRIGCSATYYSQMERGIKFPSREMAFKLNYVLGSTWPEGRGE